ncbi:hypothetical protein [Thiohalophilus sp.]|uniref:hypothetical protein n=1 Tax=Thiohalophilus sp. TaxID=3028392 RepID=UPI002ACDDD70|nr:hypothetical protein [Thiohalophilus sp.]MDZ7804628.1 hypothetical protein [Thiohalophilus sp.]
MGLLQSFLREHATIPAAKKKLVPTAWIITLVWFFFGIGPGAVIGNTIFGNPNDPSTWLFGMPSIWFWQLLWWALGVFMMWVPGLQDGNVDSSREGSRSPA